MGPGDVAGGSVGESDRAERMSAHRECSSAERLSVVAEPAVLCEVGVVAIGRNEGERLRQCLQSVRDIAGQIVYVDSASTDGSATLARSLGAAVVELDTAVPFTPGRARNAGFRRLCELLPTLRYVQFVDGDCEVARDWLGQAAAFLRTHSGVGVVSGRRRERYPDRSIYNLLCAMEWDTHPVGEAKACGGDALIRATAFAAADGYREDLMAGEEPELCARLRAAGWRVWFLDTPLTLHDAAMLRFRQWWRRAKRSGYGSMQRAWLCGARGADLEDVRGLLGTWTWALALPVVIVLGVFYWSAWTALLLLCYPLQVLRISLRPDGRSSKSWRDHLWYSLFLVLGKFPKLAGQLRFLADRYGWLRARLIEYKS